MKEVDPAVWDSVLEGESKPLMRSHAFHSAVEESITADSEYWYVLFMNDNKPVAHASIFSIYSYMDDGISGKPKEIIYKTRKVFPAFLRLKMVMCGTPVANCSNTITIADDSCRTDVLAELDRIVADIAKKVKAHIIIYRDFNEEESDKLAYLRVLGYNKVNALPATLLDINYGSFEDFICSFKANSNNNNSNENMYKNIRKYTNRFKKENIEVEICSDFSKHADRMYELYTNVLDRAVSKLEKLTPEFFINSNERLPGSVKAILFWKDGAIVAFSLVVQCNKLLTALYLGIDYEWNEKYRLYFNILYQSINYGIESKCSLIELGPTCYYPKLRLGAKLGRVYMYTKSRNKIARRLRKPLLKSMFPLIDYNDIYTAYKNGTSAY